MKENIDIQRKNLTNIIKDAFFVREWDKQARKPQSTQPRLLTLEELQMRCRPLKLIQRITIKLDKDTEHI